MKAIPHFAAIVVPAVVMLFKSSISGKNNKETARNSAAQFSVTIVQLQKTRSE